MRYALYEIPTDRLDGAVRFYRGPFDTFAAARQYRDDHQAQLRQRHLIVQQYSSWDHLMARLPMIGGAAVLVVVLLVVGTLVF